MKRAWLAFGLVWLVAAASGCALCCAPYDNDYNAFGGRWDRGDRCGGRVGSAFQPAEAFVDTEPKLGQPPIDVARQPAANTYYE